MAQAVSITKEEFETVLFPQGFQQITLQGTTELVYAKLVKKDNQTFSLRIYSSINPSGESREIGSDAIRVNCWVKINGKIIHVGGSKRVHRVAGWKKNLQNRIDKWQDCLGPSCSKCGMPTVLREPKKGQKFTPFYGCCNYPNCKGVGIVVP